MFETMQPVESQVMISASFGMDKIRPRPPQQNLVKMTRALLEEDEIYTEDRRIRLVEVVQLNFALISNVVIDSAGG